MSRLGLLLLLVASLFLAEGIYWLVRWAGERRRQEVRRRLREVGDEAPVRGSLLRSGRLARSDAIDRLLSSFGGFGGVRRLLAQTDLDWTVGTLVGYTLVGAALGAVSGLVLRLPTVAILAAIGGAAAPTLFAFRARGSRSREISKQLPEALDMIVRSLRAGHALPTAIKLAAHELPTPIATEFARCYEEQMLGDTVETAVQKMTARVPGNLDLRIFAVTVVVQRQVGGNLAEILEHIGTTVRERYKFYGQLRAMTAEGRVSGMILGSLPWLVMAVIWAARRDYLEGFWGDPMGRMMAFGAFGLWLAGIGWMKRIINVEV